ncbi:MAG: molybdopterin cofactor-binding domain-containing protein [Rhizomicrobium sp.]
MNPSRRTVLEGGLVVGFGAPFASARAKGAFGTAPSHIDPRNLDSWLKVGADGNVTAFTGKCDFGQGMFTAQTQLVAEELCVPIARVSLIQCDTALCPNQGTTSGSQSTPVNFNSENLALAAATARETLLAMAAQALGEPVAGLRVSAGVISGSTRQLSYGDLVGNRHFNVPLDRSARRRPRSQWTILGTPVASLDRPSLMTGRFEFVHNVRIPGMLHGRVVRPPQMGATLQSVDSASVRSLPGNVRVAIRKNFVGVVADTQYEAIVAAKTLAVRWTPGPALPSEEDFFAQMQSMPSHDTMAVDSGDVASALTGADRVIGARYTFPYQMHGSLGSSCAVADVRKDRATLWSPTQSAYPSRSVVAELLGLPLEAVRLIYVRGSGCYGLNGADAATFDAAVLSQAVAGPVRLQYSRQDEMRWENFGNPVVVEQRAVLAQGRIAAWDRESWVASLGGRPGYDRPGNLISGMLLGYGPEPFVPQPARPPEGRLNNNSNAVPPYLSGCINGICGNGGTVAKERVLTRTVKSPFFTGPLRSPQRVQNTFANECFMDELSAEAGADPIAFRLKHLGHPRIVGVLKQAAIASSWQTRPSPQPGRSRRGIARGRGVACVAYEGGNGYAALVAEVEVDLAAGLVHPTRFVAAMDCGPISNPDGLRNQMEGGILQAMSRALMEEVHWDDRHVTSVDWGTYPSLRLNYDMPEVVCTFVTPGGVPAAGAGETMVTITPAAIGNAVFDATGARLRDVPFTPARVKAALVHGTTIRSDGPIAPSRTRP